jgi:hypothetical protein
MSIFMKQTMLFSITIVTIVLLAAIYTTAVTRNIRHTGIFSDMRLHQETGDIIGMEVFITSSSDHMNKNYYALVQMAEGVPAPPILVPATLLGDSITFTIPKYGFFRGNIWDKKLTGSFSRSDQEISLLRTNSYWQ